MKFRILNKDPLYDYREACKITQGIELSNTQIKTPKDEVEFWIKQIIANHSTIRCLHFRIEGSAPKSVVMQLIRATKGTPRPYVQSSRPDWCGKERSNNPYEEKLFIQDHTPESFIEMCKQRLCNRTEERTRKFLKELVEGLKRSNESLLKAIGYCSYPRCYWYHGCPELKPCNENAHKFTDEFLRDYHYQVIECEEQK